MGCCIRRKEGLRNPSRIRSRRRKCGGLLVRLDIHLIGGVVDSLILHDYIMDYVVQGHILPNGYP